MTAMGLLDQFRGAGSATAAFNKDTAPGTTVAGKITAIEVRQRTEYSNKPGVIGPALFFADGKPKQQVEITVDTGRPDPANDDDGLRRFYVKMDYKSDREALFAAVDAAGADDLEVGGYFAGRFDGKGRDATGAEAGWNVHTYEYRKPGVGLAALGAQPAAPQYPAATQQAITETFPVPAPAVPAPADPLAALREQHNTVVALAGQGLTVAAIAAAGLLKGPDGSPLNQAAIQAIHDFTG